MSRKNPVDKNLNPVLVKAIDDLMKEVMEDDEASLTDKMKVIDRALNLEKIKQKISDDEWGAGFLPPEPETEEA